MLYAVVLAGIPGRIINHVVEGLRADFSDSLVVRGQGSELSTLGANYTESSISDVLRLSVDAVFGRSQRPYGFCRNSDSPCVQSGLTKRNCSKSEHQTCSLKRPDFFLLIYQSGKNEAELLRKFHHSALTISIPSTCYNKRDVTLEEVKKAVRKSFPLLGGIRRQLEAISTPLLLPPLNFKNRDHQSLLEERDAAAISARSTKVKRELFDRGRKAFVGRNSLYFAPSPTQIQHGEAGGKLAEEIALTRAYRLGCYYDNGIHFDVTKKDTSHFNGSLSFTCREVGEVYPSSKYVNLLVDDCIR